MMKSASHATNPVKGQNNVQKYFQNYFQSFVKITSIRKNDFFIIISLQRILTECNKSTSFVNMLLPGAATLEPEDIVV